MGFILWKKILVLVMATGDIEKKVAPKIHIFVISSYDI